MKNIMLLGALIGTLMMLQSCGRDTHHEHRVTSPEAIVEVFEGRFYMSGNSFIEMYQSDNFLLFSSKYQLLTTTNPVNNTFGELPKLSGEYIILQNKVKISKNLNYTPGNDIEDDTSGGNITGLRRTDITVEFIDDKLTIKYEIYSDKLNNNANFIIATRTLVQE